jgi:8-oxo-dGTP pyrophosphatase MutT (NUDIX family)
VGHNSCVQPKLAATVVVARQAGPGVEVLLLRRAPGSRFAPGYVVFPGGVVDAGDERLALRWFGDRAERTRACAVRELGEEAGLAVTGEGVRPLGPDSTIDDAVDASPPSADALHEMARWLAPEILPVRFDAWFYAVAAGPEAVPDPDGIEVDLAWWMRPADALRRFPLWRALMWPTYRTLQALTECSSVDDVLRLHVVQEPPPESLLAAAVSPEWRG